MILNFNNQLSVFIYAVPTCCGSGPILTTQNYFHRGCISRYSHTSVLQLFPAASVDHAEMMMGCGWAWPRFRSDSAHGIGPCHVRERLRVQFQRIASTVPRIGPRLLPSCYHSARTSLAGNVRLIYAYKGRQKCSAQGVTANFPIPRVLTYENANGRPNKPKNLSSSSFHIHPAVDTQ